MHCGPLLPRRRNEAPSRAPRPSTPADPGSTTGPTSPSSTAKSSASSGSPPASHRPGPGAGLVAAVHGRPAPRQSVPPTSRRVPTPVRRFARGPSAGHLLAIASTPASVLSGRHPITALERRSTNGGVGPIGASPADDLVALGPAPVRPEHRLRGVPVESPAGLVFPISVADVRRTHAR